MKTVRIVLASIVLLAFGISTTAHHSAANQDFGKRVELEGVIKLWEIANPHGRVVLHVSIAPNRDGSDGGYITGFVTAKGEKVGN
jgi:hypothetical protein